MTDTPSRARVLAKALECMRQERDTHADSLGCANDLNDELKRALEQSAAREGALEAALRLWLAYDDTAEDEFTGLAPVFAYEEAITATRAILTRARASLADTEGA